MATQTKIHSSTLHAGDASALLPRCNADGRPIVPMSEEQKYRFDLKGWICLPALIDPELLPAIRSHQLAFLYDRDSLPRQEQDNHGGPSQILLDDPTVVGVLNEILSHQGLASEDCYGFRFDHTYTSHRTAGHDNWRPHGGSGFFNFPGSSHMYHMQQGKVHSGLTRVVWELNDVRPGDGATRFLSGSHKAAFSRPASSDSRDSDLWESYSCPAGSCVIFTEALTHTGDTWTNERVDRLSLFTCYDTARTADKRKKCIELYFDTANRSSIWTQPAAARQSLREGSSRFYKDDKSKPNADNNALGDGRGLISSAARSEDRQAASKAAKAKADKKLAAARL